MFHQVAVMTVPRKGFWNRLFFRKSIKVYFDGSVCVEYPSGSSSIFQVRKLSGSHLLLDDVCIFEKTADSTYLSELNNGTN